MKSNMKLKSIRLTAIAVAIALVCSYAAIAGASRAASIFEENYSLSSFSLFGLNSDLNNSIRRGNIADKAMLTPTVYPKIVFVSDRYDSYGDIFTMNPDGGYVTRLTDNNNRIDSDPAFSPDGSKIVFASDRDSQYRTEIYVMNSDGTDQVRLTYNATTDWQPSFSPDGSKIVFTSNINANDDIYIMNVDGSNLVRLTTYEGEDLMASFSPDGAKIIFYSYRDGNGGDIFTMNADGSNQTNLTNSQFTEYSPSYSHDGSKIVFSRSGEFSNSDQIYIMNSDGTNQTRLTNSEDYSPAFSLEDDKIIFSTKRDSFYDDIYSMNTDGTNLTRLTNLSSTDTTPKWQPIAMPPPSGEIVFSSGRDGNYEIYTMEAEGANQFRLTNNHASDINPSFSPDGSKIVFASDIGNAGNDIYTINPDGTNRTRLTDNQVNDSEPHFSSDGSKIVFISERDGNGEVYVMNADGTGQTRLTNTYEWEYSPSFSPAGGKIVFSRVSNGGLDVFVMNVNGANVTQLTNAPEIDSTPSFSPDGSKITFHSSRNGYHQIYVMNPDGTNQTPLAYNESLNLNPAFSSDGSKIAFSSNRDTGYLGNLEIYVMNTDGSGVLRLTNLHGNDNFPNWRRVADPQCAFDIDPTGASPDAGGGNGVIVVTASDSSCAWTATENHDWISITSGANGTGSGSITYNVQPNGELPRAGTISIGGLNFTITQSALDPINVSMPSVRGIPSQILTIPVNVSDTTGRGIVSFDFNVLFDPEVLMGAAVFSTPMTSGMTLNIGPDGAGRVRVSGFGTTPLSGSGTMVELQFAIIGSPASCSPLHFVPFIFNDGLPYSTTTDGEICASPTVTGVVNYANTTELVPVPNVTISSVGSTSSSTTTGAQGLYGFALGSGIYTVTPSKTGDVNNAVAALDASLVARYAVGLETFTTTQSLTADVSGSGSINSYDAALIAQYAANINNPGNAGSWKFLPASRTYDNVAANQYSQDYGAILMGDVTGNWTAANPLVEFGRNESQPDANAVQVAFPTLRAEKNQTVTVPISVGDVTGRNFLAYDLDVSFDPAVLRLDTANPVDRAGTVSRDLSVMANPNTPGRLRVTAYGVNYLQGAGTLLNLRFKVIGRAGQTSPLTFERLVFNENPALSVTQNGQVNVTATTASHVDIGGHITTAGGSGIRNVVVIMTDAGGNVRTTVTGSLGYYSFADVAVGNGYTFTVSAKRHTFSQPVRTINIDSATDDINFVADN